MLNILNYFTSWIIGIKRIRTQPHCHRYSLHSLQQIPKVICLLLTKIVANRNLHQYWGPLTSLLGTNTEIKRHYLKYNKNV